LRACFFPSFLTAILFFEEILMSRVDTLDVSKKDLNSKLKKVGCLPNFIFSRELKDFESC